MIEKGEWVGGLYKVYGHRKDHQEMLSTTIIEE